MRLWMWMGEVTSTLGIEDSPRKEKVLEKRQTGSRSDYFLQKWSKQSSEAQQLDGTHSFNGGTKISGGTRFQVTNHPVSSSDLASTS